MNTCAWIGQTLIYNRRMLTRISLRNFKAHVDTQIEAAPLTVFIGPNNSGKSSVFQALLLWRQAAARNQQQLCLGPSRQHQQPYIFADDQLIDIGDFDQVAQGTMREIGIGVSGTLPPTRQIVYGPGPVMAQAEVLVRDNQLVHHSGSVRYEIEPLKRGEFRWQWVQLGPQNQVSVAVPFPQASNGTPVTFLLSVQQTFQLLTQAGFSYTSPIEPQPRLALQELSQRMGDSLNTLLRSIHVVFPLRGLEEVGYPLPDGPSPTMDRMAVADRTMALLSILAYNRDIERRLSKWLEDLVGIRIETKLLPPKRVTISSYPAGTSGSELFSNQGTGTSQLPFILVPIGLMPPGETILLSEPEVHLHPKLQVQLTKLLVQLMKTEQRQFFIETHSEHVLHALLNAVAKDVIKQSDLAIYYFENKDGRAVTTRLNVDARGGVEGGLPGFFDQSLDEVSEYLAALKSK